jgi:DNA-binding XRE family transcriptional regulator
MRALVKTQHIKIDAEIIPDELLSFLKTTYGEVTIIPDTDDDLIEVKKTAWYKTIKATMTSAENVKLLRKSRKLTQAQLGKSLGGIPKQTVSNIEHGTRPISKEMAKKLSEVFNISVDNFIS